MWAFISSLPSFTLQLWTGLKQINYEKFHLISWEILVKKDIFEFEDTTILHKDRISDWWLEIKKNKEKDELSELILAKNIRI